MYCPKCGEENPEDAMFCMHCRAVLSGYKMEILPNIEVSPRISVSTMDKEQINLLVEDKLSKALEKTPAFNDIQRKKEKFTLEEEQLIDLLLSAGKGKSVSLSKYSSRTLEKCADFFDNVSEERPEIKSDEWFWNCKCAVLFGLGKYDESLESCDKMFDINPLSYAGWHNKGTILEHLNSYDGANRCFDKALEINPKNDEAWTEKCFLLMKEYQKLFQEVLEGKISPGDYKSKKLELNIEAKSCINKALEINPKNERAWVLKSVSILGSDINESIRCINKALEINSRSVGALFQMGMRKYQLALDFKTEKLPPTIVWDRDLLWEAIEWFDKSLRIDPYFSEALKRKEETLKTLREL